MHRAHGTTAAGARRAALAICAAVVVAPATAWAADTPIATDPAADEIAALDGTIVWVGGRFGDQVLMQRTAAGIAPVKGAPRARSYRSIDLGRDGKNRLVLTYQRCGAGNRCKTMRDNLEGERATFKHLALKRCSLTTAPALWRSRAAYGLSCRTASNRADDRRSGLYVRSAGHAPRRMRLPRDAVRFGVTNIASVDLRGTQVAAVAADVFEYAFTETVNRAKLHSLLVAASEGDSDEHANGLALGPGNVLWALVDSAHAGDPNRATIYRVTGSCFVREELVNPAGPGQEDGFRATDLAVDGANVYLVVPGSGIVRHDFAAQPEGCRRP